jgi:hypothetical protein
MGLSLLYSPSFFGSEWQVIDARSKRKACTIFNPPCYELSIECLSRIVNHQPFGHLNKKLFSTFDLFRSPEITYIPPRNRKNRTFEAFPIFRGHVPLENTYEILENRTFTPEHPISENAPTHIVTIRGCTALFAKKKEGQHKELDEL